MNGKSSKPRPIRDYKHLANEWDRIFKRKSKPSKRDIWPEIVNKSAESLEKYYVESLEKEILNGIPNHEHQKTLGTSRVGKETHGKLHRKRRLERPDESAGQGAQLHGRCVED